MSHSGDIASRLEPAGAQSRWEIDLLEAMTIFDFGAIFEGKRPVIRGLSV